MDQNSKVAYIVVSLVIVMLAYIFVSSAITAYGEIPKDLPKTPLGNLARALHVFADGQSTIIDQNSILIEQNWQIIDLLKGDRETFVAGVTDRYVPIKWINYGTYECFDKLERIIVKHSCELPSNLTRDQFISLVTGNPES